MSETAGLMLAWFSVERQLQRDSAVALTSDA